MVILSALSIGSNIASFFKSIISVITGTAKSLAALITFTTHAGYVLPSIIGLVPPIIGASVSLVFAVSVVKLIIGR